MLVGHMQCYCCSARQLQAFTGFNTVERLRGFAIEDAYFYNPQVCWQMRGKVQLKERSVAAGSMQSRVEGATGVNDQSITRCQEVYNLPKLCMHYAVV